MPIFRLETNVSEVPKRDEFKSEVSAAVAKHLGKPEKFVQVILVVGVDMIMGGTADPCGSASLASIGGLGIEENKKISADISAVIEKHVGIKADRCYINFVDMARADVGFNGSTFHK